MERIFRVCWIGKVWEFLTMREAQEFSRTLPGARIESYVCAY